MPFGQDRVRAPELRGAGWLNTPEPLTLAGLRGQLVLLDFWTSGCINCLHVLEDLAYLERKYAGLPFAVIGVHSPKFAREEDPRSVLDSIRRNGVAHPVLLDNERRTWDAYAVKGWPTLVLISPDGYILGQVAGEGHRGEVDAAIGVALGALNQGEGEDARGSLMAVGGAVSMDVTPLRYPGKVLADEPADALVVADTGHHRLVWAAPDGTSVETIGTGEAGAEDGTFESASFRGPHGVALDAAKRMLYVADTGNHLIRRVDLVNRSVTTVAGTGELGYRFDAVGPALDIPLNSPWDVCLIDGYLYIAMAGLHQIWRYDPQDKRMGVAAGIGAEGRADGPAATAIFAQPSGLATDGRRLFISDAESSSVRVMTFDPEGVVVRTLAGGDLFLFGDADGVGDDARFQHPQGLAWAPSSGHESGTIYVADTYNSLIRKLDPEQGAVTTLRITNVGGAPRESPPAFKEPGGITYARGRLYVADTNNHRIGVMGLDGSDFKTLRLVGLCPPGFCLPE